MSRKTKVGDYIRTIPEIQASVMALRGQLADTLSFMRKAQHYDNGSIMSSITSSITPAVCAKLNPPLGKTDFDNHVIVKFNQYILKKVLEIFKRSPYYRYVYDKSNTTKLEKGLQLWWAWAGKEVLKSVKTTMLAEASAANFKDNIPYTDVSASKDQYEKYRLLLDSIVLQQ